MKNSILIKNINKTIANFIMYQIKRNAAIIINTNFVNRKIVIIIAIFPPLNILDYK